MTRKKIIKRRNIKLELRSILLNYIIFVAIDTYILAVLFFMLLESLTRLLNLSDINTYS